jgi:hypothetical protein
MFCEINPDQKDAFTQKVTQDMIKLAKRKNPQFNLQEYVTSIYKNIEKKHNNAGLALAYTKLIPVNLEVARLVDDGIAALLNPYIKEISDLKNSFKSVDNIILYVQATSEDTEEALQIAEEKRKQALEEIEKAEKELQSYSVRMVFSGRPITLNSTTLGNDPDSSKPGNKFIQILSDNYISEYGNNALAQIQSKYKLLLVDGADKNFVRDSDTDDSNLKKGSIFLVTDPNGNILYFDHQELLQNGVIKEVSKSVGNPIIFRQRRNLSTVQTVEEIAKQQQARLGISKEQVESEINNSKREADKKAEYVTDRLIAGNSLLHSIVNFSTGYLEINTANPVALKDTNLNTEDYQVKILNLKANEQKIAFQKNNFTQPIVLNGFFINKPDSPFNIPSDLRDALVKTLIGNDVKLPGLDLSPSNPTLITARKNFIGTYLRNNKNIIIESDGRLYINGRQITDKDKNGNFVLLSGNTEETVLQMISSYTNNKKEQVSQAVVLTIDTEKNIPYKHVRNDDGTYNLVEINYSEYKNLLKNLTYTDTQKNPTTGNFDSMHPYFVYELLEEERNKLENKEEKAVKESLAEKEVIVNEKLKSSDTNISKIEKLEDDDWNKLVSQRLSKATQEQIEEAKEWWNNHPMSSKVPFNAMFSLFNPKNAQSIATFNKYGVTLYKGSDYTDVYHEAFHAFSQLFLTKSEQAKMYAAVQKLKGSTVDYLGNKVNFSDMSDKQAEEYLAEKFREYMLSGGKTFAEGTPKEAKNWFEKLLEILSVVFGFDSLSIDNTTDNYTATRQINEYFKNLREGNISDVEVNFEVTPELDKLKAVKAEDEERVDSLTYSDLKVVLDTMNSIISTVINERDEKDQKTGKKYSSIVTSLNDRVILYRKVYNKLTDIYNQYVDAFREMIENTKEYEETLYKINVLGLALRNYSTSMAESYKITADDVLSASNPNAKGLIAYHIQKSDFITLDDVYDVEEESKSGKDYVKNEGNKKSARELADKDVLFLLRSLQKKTKNIFGVYELEDFIYSWNLVSKISKGASTAQDIYKAFQNFVNRKEESDADKHLAQQILNKMGDPNVSIDGSNFKDYLPQQNLWTKFQNVFTLPTIKLIQLTVEYNTESDLPTVKLSPGIAKSSTDAIKRGFDNSFGVNNSEYVIASRSNILGNEKKATTGNFLNIDKVLKTFSKKPITIDDKFKFLHAVGINITNNRDMATVLSTNNNIQAFISQLYDKLQEINIINTALKNTGAKVTYISGPSNLVQLDIPETNSIFNLTSAYRELLDNDIALSGKYGQGMVSNAKGDPQYEISLKSAVSEQIRLFNSAKSYQELISIPEMAHLDIKRNPFVRSLKIMIQTFGENFWEPGKGKRQSLPGYTAGYMRNNEFQLLNSSGVSLIHNDILRAGVSSNEADDTTQILQNFFTYMLYGVNEATRHSDKSTTLYYKSSINGEYIPFRNFFGEFRDIKVTEIMREYLADEVSRMVRLINNDPSGTATVGDSTYKEEGSKLVIFEGILDKTLRTSIEDWALKYKVKAKTGFSSIQEDFKKTWLEKNTDTVNQQIIKYFADRNAEFKTDLTKTGVLNNPMWQDLKSQVRNVQEYKTRVNFDDSLIDAFVVNDWLHKYEITSLLYGDVALYNHLKEEFHKRNPFIAATGTIPRSDAAMINFLSAYTPSEKYARSKYFKGTLTERAKTKKWGRVLDSAVLEDTAYESELLKDYIKATIDSEETRLGRDLTETEKGEIRKEFKEYSKMKIGDGQGWITFDSYRNLLISMSKWSPYQEDLYWDIINGKDTSKINIMQFFPIKKMQYGGPLANKLGLPLMGFHKFSLMPLIPSLVKNTNLEVLHNKMVSQGIDYALFQSGSKINTITKNGTPDKFYKNNKDLKGGVEFSDDDYEFTINPIFTNYFKDQVETQETYKGKVVFSTQLRKLVEEGLYEKGRPKSFKGSKKEFDELPETEKIKYPEYVKLNTYEKFVTQLTEYKIRELQKEAGLQITAGNKIVLTQKLVDYLNKQLTQQDLAEHEIDFIKYDARQGKLVFDLSYHPSANKLDKLISALIYKKIVKQKVKGEALIQVSGAGFEPSGLRAATEIENERFQKGLPFYTYNKSGTSAMKVKIAMQGDFKKLLSDSEVLKLVKQKKAQGEIITPLDALNILLKDIGWMSKNRKMVTITGVRIPVQGLNSMEFMEVFEFLPEENGNLIVLPREIVAKTGGDFDIDKLSLMFPSLIKTKKGVSLIKYNQKDEQNLDKNKETLTKLLDTRQDLLEKFSNWVYTGEDTEKKKVYEETKAQIETLKIKRSTYKEDLNLSKRAGLDDAEFLYNQVVDISNEIEELYDVLFQIGAGTKEIATALRDINNDIDDIRVLIASGSSKGIENDLMFSVVDILSMPQNFVDLITPNTTSILKPIADDLSKFSDYDRYHNIHDEKFVTSENKKRITATKIFELGYNRYKQRSNNIGKRTLGIGAVNNTFNTILNRVGAYMEKQIELGVKKKYTVTQTFRGGIEFNKTENGEISLSDLYDAKNQYRISKLISQGINGWVDVAKDSWIFDIQGNPEIGPILLFMLQAGVPVEQAVYFLSQPVIKEYVTRVREIRGGFAIPLGVEAANSNKFRNQARADILSKLDPTLKDQVVQLTKTFSVPVLDNRQIKKFIYDTLVPAYLEGTADVDFSEKTLKALLESPITDDVTSSMQIFLHFVEIEEMSKAITELQQGLNFDTSKLGSMYDINQKSLNVDSLNREGRLNNSVVSDIMNNSPIGSFIRSKDEFIMFLEDLFPIRSDENLYKTLNTFSKMSDDIQEDYPFYFSDFDELATQFINDFTNFVFQQYQLNKDKTFNALAPFKGLTISEDQKQFAVAQSRRMTQRSVIADGGVLYVNPKLLKQEFKNRTYAKLYFNEETQDYPAPAPVSEFIFNNYTDYVKFVYTRESLRSMISFDDYSTSKDYEVRLKASSHTVDEDIKVYEEFLRDTAMIYASNNNYMFSANGYASQISFITKKFPDLIAEYKVLGSLYASVFKGTHNLKLSELVLDSDIVNIYHEELLRLANPNINKVDNVIDNQIISDLFAKFPLFAFLQNGLDGKGQFSLSRIVPTTMYSDLLQDSGKWYQSEVIDKEKFVDAYKSKFNNKYKKPDLSAFDEDAEFISTGRSPIRKNYSISRINVSGEEESFVEKDSFVYQDPYNSSVLLYNYSGTAESLPGFEKQIINTIEEKKQLGKNVIFVFSKGVNEKSIASTSEAFNPAVLIKMAEEGKISKDNIFGITTKAINYAVMEKDLLTDATYKVNTDRIEKELQELYSKVDEKTEVVFLSSGIGLGLLGYGFSEAPKKQKDGSIKRTFVSPYKDLSEYKPGDKNVAPGVETYVYLSKRLHDLFGYLNTDYLGAISSLSKEGKAFRDDILTKEPISNATVMEILNNCFSSLLDNE